MIALGVILLLDRLGYVHFSVRDLVPHLLPLLLIGLGLRFLWRALALNRTAPPLRRDP